MRINQHILKTSSAQHSTLNVQLYSMRGVGRSVLNVERSKFFSRAQNGIALVMTLILLSVITFLTVTFLVISRREKGSVVTMTDQTTARLAADAALERAKAELLLPMLVATNGQLFDLRVSTNYFDPYGFIQANNNPTNVNFDRSAKDGGALNQDDFRQNIANLLYSPRVPVFVQTNDNKNLPLDFRFYLDLNRNGRFDTNGLLPVINPVGGFYDTNGNEIPNIISGNTLSNVFVGDPEWVGILENPSQPHSSSNRFVARYAFVAVPTGRTLDVNYMHNYARRQSPVMQANLGDGFYRNQGVGTWEMNLAAFLVDLNTNEWQQAGNFYDYRTNYGLANVGVAFDDALSLLRYRYGGNYSTLRPAIDVFTNTVTDIFKGDNIDEYSDGDLMTGLSLNNEFVGNYDDAALPWPGADNPNHYFSHQDFFDTAKASGFSQRLSDAGNHVSSYDRYTFYRMLSELGTDTGPETGKLNVNYVNTVAAFNSAGILTNSFTSPDLITNLTGWTPLQFFTLAADRLLRTYSTNWFLSQPADYMMTFFNANTNGLTGLDVGSVATKYGLTDASGKMVVPALSITNIPVWVSNRFVYTPSVQRLLQLAANIYDATTNRPASATPGGPYPPTVFRPFFRRESTNLYIAGFEQIPGITLPLPNPTSLGSFTDLPVEARDLAQNLSLPTGLIYSNVYNVPWIVGAKEGYPNFNEFAMQNTVYAARRLEFRRANIFDNPNLTSNPVRYTNQLYSLGVSNVFGMELWNSYKGSFPRPLTLSARAEVTMVVHGTNNGVSFMASNVITVVTSSNVAANAWTGITNDPQGNISFPAASFKVALLTNFIFFTNNYGFLQSAAGFNGVPGSFQRVASDNPYPIPQWRAKLTSRVRYFLLDNTNIVDYVTLSKDEAELDMMSYLMEGSAGLLDTSPGGQWDTNRIGGSPADITIGIRNQILAGTGQIPVDWNAFNYDAAAGRDPKKAQGFFSYQFNPTNSPNSLYEKTNIFEAPYTSFRTIVQKINWQANDPLVHYTLPDLFDPVQNPLPEPIEIPPAPIQNIGQVNVRYQPWGAGPQGQVRNNGADFNPAEKDPLVYQSDDWNFPTNKLPNIGWLGRVHRGTPWQTVYMKGWDNFVPFNPYFSPIATNAWGQWTGETNYFEASLTLPKEDWLVFDIFTTALNKNATRGQLSVNQSGVAAWSAVLSGVITLTNATADDPLPHYPLPVDPIVIEPAGSAGTNSPVGWITKAINDYRSTNTALFPDGVFEHAGDILAVPELTVNSPFLHFDPINLPEMPFYGISEEMYERIPQQIMSLLRLGEPRFVIYAYGQALRPAPRSIITSGDFFGMCTNYQVTAEVASRAVVRVDGAPRRGDTNSTPRLVLESFNAMGPD